MHTDSCGQERLCSSHTKPFNMLTTTRPAMDDIDTHKSMLEIREALSISHDLWLAAANQFC
jgi:hypothetical protein